MTRQGWIMRAGTRAGEGPEWPAEFDFIRDGWVVYVRLDTQRGRRVVTDVRVFPDLGNRTDVSSITGEEIVWERPIGTWIGRLYGRSDVSDVPEGGVTTTLLRSIPFGHLFETARREDQALAAYLEEVGEGTPGWGAELAEMAADARRLPDEFLAGVARYYLRRVALDSPSPIADTAMVFRANHATVADWIKKARRRGLLTSRGGGRPGGELTKEAKRLLTAAHEGE